MSQDERTASEDARRELERARRRLVFRAVILPMLALLAVVIAAVGVAMTMRSPVQVAVLTDSMLTALVLLPLAVCMFPVMILSLALVALTSRLTGRARSPLRRLEALTAGAESKVEIWLRRVDGRVLEWAVRLAPMRQLLMIFDAPEPEARSEEET